MGGFLYIKSGQASLPNERDRLSHEIWRLQQELARLSKRVSGVRSNSSKGVLAKNRARHVLKLRSYRRQIFNAAIFGEPAWDMLLQLYDAQFEGRTECLASLCSASGVPPSTALRWIDYLLDEYWIVREGNPGDQRQSHVSLTPKGLDAMARFFDQPEFTGALLVEAETARALNCSAETGGSENPA